MLPASLTFLRMLLLKEFLPGSGKVSALSVPDAIVLWMYRIRRLSQLLKR